ncbi:hypothetical protein [Haloarcula nitratireducens]|uniref:Uncharacterized protein n=1 Tax=Haloarcula nitratireducens TaxID=2487749 RepID=A0AAW4PE31_9EURY|nr:hypothetical protein [Halomicroarcula nitratireducens]MBX0296206.1 hypothetical protein [Halomicroarcula nitratireducens]
MFDSELATAGLEHECYVVGRTGALTTLPDTADDLLGCEKEVGRHRLEFQLSPRPFTAAGRKTIESEMRARFEAASDALLDSDEQLVSDGMWTIPPRDRTAVEYFTASDSAGAAPLPKHMVDAVRYHVQGLESATRIDAPHVSYQGETALPTASRRRYSPTTSSRRRRSTTGGSRRGRPS